MSSHKRRKLLMAIAAGSGAVIAGKGLPESWSRPVVDSVLLPAHAQTSLARIYTTVASRTRQDGQEDSLYARALDGLVPEAMAGGISGTCITACGTITGELMALEGVDICGPATFSGQLPLNGRPVQVTFHNCIGGSMSLNLSIKAIDANTATITDPVGNTFDMMAAEVCAAIPEVCVDSDRNIKANFAPVDEQEVLRKVAELPIETWNYTDREPGVRHIGPMAQDFMAAFGVGDSDRHIHLVDANGVNLAAIKALNARLEEKDAQIAALQEQLDKVLRKLDTLS